MGRVYQRLRWKSTVPLGSWKNGMEEAEGFRNPFWLLSQMRALNNKKSDVYSWWGGFLYVKNWGECNVLFAYL